jgi:hypothetical protein
MNRERSIEIIKLVWSEILEKNITKFDHAYRLKMAAIHSLVKKQKISNIENALLIKNHACAFCVLYKHDKCVECPGMPLWNSGCYMECACELSVSSPYRHLVTYYEYDRTYYELEIKAVEAIQQIAEYSYE